LSAANKSLTPSKQSQKPQQLLRFFYVKNSAAEILFKPHHFSAANICHQNSDTAQV
jgi:hypothetical protein